MKTALGSIGLGRDKRLELAVGTSEISAEEIERRKKTLIDRRKEPLFNDPLPEIDAARRAQIARDFRAGGGLISTYAMRTKTHPVEATRDLMAAGMLAEDDPIAKASMENTRYRVAADGTLPDGVPTQPEEHQMTSLAAFDKDISDHKKGMPALAQNREAVGVMMATRKRLSETKEQEAPSGMLAPSYERAARAVQAQWEAGGRQDNAARMDATDLMRKAMVDSSVYVHTEKVLEARASQRLNPIQAAAMRLAGTRKPARPRNTEAVEL